MLAGWLGAAQAHAAGCYRLHPIGCRGTAAYGRRSERPGYMLLTPAAGRDWQRKGAGRAPGAAASARTVPEERTEWWKTRLRHGLGYTRHTTEALAEGAALVPVGTGTNAAARVIACLRYGRSSEPGWQGSMRV
jgi:hypothetical protein